VKNYTSSEGTCQEELTYGRSTPWMDTYRITGNGPRMIVKKQGKRVSDYDAKKKKFQRAL